MTLDEARSAIAAAGYARIEYLELRAEEDLAPMHRLDRPGRLLVAAWLGETRLIDNVGVPSRPGAIWTQRGETDTWYPVTTAAIPDRVGPTIRCSSPDQRIPATLFTLTFGFATAEVMASAIR
ncbi:hypothetical protein BQ8482_130073 [Mesorhizobium delmotii]|uniref:Pantoate--beta-alanine ligase n=1 Tax=Mesorhizobium delmotii TaxID=1631247 RepID=A0A2P9AGD4_9HYPH|nr:hypothetical protein BQ8482_130073 [Mesorhizobium delmotii]